MLLSITVVVLSAVYRGFLCEVISSQFTSHHIRDRHVGFLFTLSGTGKYNKMANTIKTLPNYNWVTRILAHTLSGNLNCFYKVLKSKKFKLFLLFFSILGRTKRKPSDVAKSCVYGCITWRANPLFIRTWEHRISQLTSHKNQLEFQIEMSINDSISQAANKSYSEYF